jgi:hypothetical protein
MLMEFREMDRVRLKAAPIPRDRTPKRGREFQRAIRACVLECGAVAPLSAELLKGIQTLVCAIL